MNANKRILVVDDEPDVLIYISTLFEDNGFDTVTAENGIVAFELAKSEKPDLITLDITMPEQSGIKTYRYLKDEPECRNIPIVIISAVGDPVKSVMNEFADCEKPEAFFSKPIDQKALIAKVTELVS